MKKQKLRRRSPRFFTLIELLVAMTLLSLLITFLFSTYSQLSVQHAEIDRVRQLTFKKRYLQNRLFYLLSRTIPNTHNNAKDFYFYTTGVEARGAGASLTFSFDNGVDLDPFFSTNVLGMLYMDSGENERGRLMFNTWPVPRCFPDVIPPMKKEMLFEGVASLKFSFYYPRNPLVEMGIMKEDDKIPEDQWYPEWVLDYQRLPAIVKVFVELDNVAAKEYGTHNLIFAIPLASSAKPIVINR